MAVGRALDEHHRRQVVNVPVARDLDQARHLAPDQGLHPLLRLLAVVDLGPGIASPQPVHLAVVVRHGVVVLDAVREQQLHALLARLPPGSDDSARGLAAELGEQAVRLVEDVALLLEGHVGRVLVAVAMQADLVAGVADCSALLGEGLKGVAGDEPGGLDVVFLKELQQAHGADMAGPEAYDTEPTMVSYRPAQSPTRAAVPLLMSLTLSAPP